MLLLLVCVEQILVLCLSNLTPFLGEGGGGDVRYFTIGRARSVGGHVDAKFFHSQLVR